MDSRKGQFEGEVDELGNLIRLSLLRSSQALEPPDRVWQAVSSTLARLPRRRGGRWLFPAVWIGPVWEAGRSRLVWIHGARFDDVGDLPPRLAWC